MPASRARRRTQYPWARYRTERLLDLRFCDLGLRLEGSWVEARIERLYDELASRGLRFRPHCWLSTEWFAPSDVPGIAVPFYLAHPRLRRLEDRMMLEVEGGTHRECMRLLRHEAGHAFETAYRLAARPRWKRVFGRADRPYPRWYRPRPFSRRYVLHLDGWYAQSHPTEDFAETFAVWLAPGHDWRREYAGWPALRKLEYVDALMREIASRPPRVRTRRRVDPLSRVRTTLREHYAERQARYSRHYPDVFDRDLHRLFGASGPGARAPAAASYLRRMAPRLRRVVAAWTGEPQYAVDQVLKDMIVRCRELDLRVTRSEAELETEMAAMLTVQTLTFVHATEHKVAV